MFHGNTRYDEGNVGPVGQSCLGRIYKGLRQPLICDFSSSIRIDRYVLNGGCCMILQLCQDQECVFDASVGRPIIRSTI